MLVWGDQVRIENPEEKLGRVEGALHQLATIPAGIERHSALVAAFIEAGELAQGVADSQLTAAGCDARSAADRAAMALLTKIAAVVRESWTSGFARLGPLPERELRALATSTLPSEICTKRAEGFALYSLYPESYLEAVLAAQLDHAQPTRVVGIRSIGAPLAALVAAGLDAAPPLTLRPTGELPHRQVVMAEDLAAELLADAGSVRFAVVDEGPGLSGSSFGAVADFLEDRGVAPERIHYFASHAGPLGPSARPRHRQRWAKATLHVADLGTLLVHSPRRPEHRLASWVADLVGERKASLEEISGGRWRPLRYAQEADWPASNVYLERRKFLLRGCSGAWLLKFVGLGQEGARKLDRARVLHAAGFVPEPAGYRHGFLVERWLGATSSLDREFGICDRAWLVTQVGRYLGFRARHFPASSPDRGASLTRLWEMARYNSVLAFGKVLAARLDRWRPMLERLERVVRPVEIDGRLHAWEWLLTRDGCLLKTDALDHHAGHDLVGCQDIAWDIVGAKIELGLTPLECDRLCGVVEAEAEYRIDPSLLALLAPCYLALQMGDRSLATEIVAKWSSEVERLRADAGRYATLLRQELLAGI